jgi:hypothetical protein
MSTRTVMVENRWPTVRWLTLGIRADDPARSLRRSTHNGAEPAHYSAGLTSVPASAAGFALPSIIRTDQIEPS